MTFFAIQCPESGHVQWIGEAKDETDALAKFDDFVGGIPEDETGTSVVALNSMLIVELTPDQAAFLDHLSGSDGDAIDYVDKIRKGTDHETDRSTT